MIWIGLGVILGWEEPNTRRIRTEGGEGRRSIERGKEGEEFCGLNLFLTGSELTFYVGRATLLHLLDHGAHGPILQQFAANHFQSEYATTAPGAGLLSQYHVANDLLAVSAHLPWMLRSAEKRVFVGFFFFSLSSLRLGRVSRENDRGTDEGGERRVSLSRFRTWEPMRCLICNLGRFRDPGLVISWIGFQIPCVTWTDRYESNS